MDRLEQTWLNIPKECTASVSDFFFLVNCILYVEIEMFIDPVRGKISWWGEGLEG